LKIWYCQYIQ
jgi:hypothetical protein